MLVGLSVRSVTDIPTLAEFMPDYEASQWYGVGAPKDTPAEVIDKLNKEIKAVVADLQGAACQLRC
jgi:tripartite-type tricarboxylate transporter receptor subunit TctC